MPLVDSTKCSSIQHSSRKVLLTTHGRSLEREFKAAKLLLTIIVKEVAKDSLVIPSEVKEFIEEFFYLVPMELPNSLPPIREIQH